MMKEKKKKIMKPCVFGKCDVIMSFKFNIFEPVHEPVRFENMEMEGEDF